MKKIIVGIMLLFTQISFSGMTDECVKYHNRDDDRNHIVVSSALDDDEADAVLKKYQKFKLCKMFTDNRKIYFVFWGIAAHK